MNPLNGGHWTVNLISNDTTRYMVMWAENEDLIVGRQVIGQRNWTTFRIAPGTIAGNPLNLPGHLDTHCNCAIALMGDGSLKVWANMHKSTVVPTAPLQMIKCPNPAGALNVWLADTLPGAMAANSYPTPIHHPDGSVRFYIRCGDQPSGSGRSDGFIWDAPAVNDIFGPAVRIFQGLSVPNAKGQNLVGDNSNNDTGFNWSPYHAVPYVQDLGGGDYIEHWCWVWRRDGADVDPARTNVKPSYMTFDSRDGLWRSINGTVVNLPIDPINDVAVQTGLVGPPNAAQPTSGNYTNGMAITLDGSLKPHIIASKLPFWHMFYDGAAWQQELVGTYTPGGVFGVGNALIAGNQRMNSRLTIYWHDGFLWYLGSGGDTGGNQQQCRLWRADGAAQKVTLASYVPVTNECEARAIIFGEPFEAYADPEAYRRRGTIEVLIPFGDTPYVRTFGNNTQMAAG